MSIDTSPVVATGVTPERLADLRRWNLGLTVLHAVQAVLIAVMAGRFAITFTANINRFCIDT